MIDENTLKPRPPSHPSAMEQREHPEEHAPVLRVWLMDSGRLAWRVPPCYEQEPWSSRRTARAIFFLLLCAPNRQALRGQLIGILWPETPEENAQSNLRSALKVLRQVLRQPPGDDPLMEATQNREALQLKGQEIIWTDVDALERLVQQANQEPDPQRAFLLWQQARALLKGEVLAEDRLHEWVNHRWIKVKRHRMQALRRHVIRSLADLSVQRGEQGQAITLLQEHIISFPTDQDALYRLLKLLMQAECFEEARATYERGKVALQSLGKSVTESVKGLAEHLMTLPQTLLPTMSLITERSSYTTRSTSKEGSEIDPNTQLHRLEKQEKNVAYQDLLQTPLALAPSLSVSALHQELVSKADATIKYCWQLYFSGGAFFVEQFLPTFLSHVVSQTQHPSKYQTSFAMITSQAYQLVWLLCLQHQDFGQALTAIKQALFYAEVAHDPNLLLASLVREAHTFFHLHNPMHQLYLHEKAIQYVQKTSPLLQSWLYIVLAESHAHLQHEKEAALFLGLARDTFPEKPEHDPNYSYVPVDAFCFANHEVMAHLHLHHPTHAWNILTTFQKIDPSDPLHIEFTNRQLATLYELGDLQETCSQFEVTTPMVKQSGSALRYNEVCTIYTKMRITWPSEARVRRLEEILRL